MRGLSKQACSPNKLILPYAVFYYISVILVTFWKLLIMPEYCRILPRASGWRRIVMKSINPQNFHCQLKQLQCHCFKLKAIYISLSDSHWSVSSFSARGAAIQHFPWVAFSSTSAQLLVHRTTSILCAFRFLEIFHLLNVPKDVAGGVSTDAILTKC